MSIKLAKRLIAQAKSSNATTLDLGNCGLTEPDQQIPELFELTQLEELIFSNKYYNYEQVTFMWSINQGEKNLLSQIPKGLVKLQQLKKLVLSYNQIQKLENLPQNLRSFYISNNQIQKLENLPPSLHTLDINANQIQKLENLPPSLYTFYISENQIQKLENLPKNLHTFDISDNQIQKLENLSGCLNSFDISSNQVQQLQNLPPNLHTFNISDNQIQKLENLPKNLYTFDISYNQINDLLPLKSFIEKWIPIELYSSQKGRIYIGNNPLENPPEEIIKKGNLAILDYFQQLEEEKGKKDYLFEAKLLIIGEAGAGKTTFARRIQNPLAVMPATDESTHGIHIDRWKFPIPAGTLEEMPHKESTFFVNLWDFGGQEIYHATHQFFFSEKSLYVLLADTREQKTDFSYWLNTVEQLCGEDSLLFILLNKRAKHDWKIDEPGLRARFGKLMRSVHTIDLSVSADIPDLQSQIKACLHQLEGIGQPLIKSWVEIRNQLAQEKQNHLSFERFRAICAEHGVTKDEYLENISQYFHRIGVFTHYIDEPALQDRIYLNSNQLVHKVYQVLDHELVVANKGRVNHAQLKKVLGRFETGRMIVLLEKFGLMYSANQNQYIVPRHLPKIMPYAEWQHAHESELLQFRYQFDQYMPKGLMSRLIVALHDYIPNHNWVWHRGVHLQYNGAYAEIVVQYSGINQFDIRIAGLFQRDLLVIITQAFDKILSDFRKLQTDKSLRCPCEECTESNTPYYHKISDIEQALVKKYKKLNPKVECKLSYEDIPLRDLLAVIDYESIWAKLREKSRESVFLEKMAQMKQEITATVKQEGKRISFHLDNLESRLQQKLQSLNLQQQSEYKLLLTEIQQTQDTLFSSNAEQRAFFQRLEPLIQREVRMTQAELEEWQNSPVQHKIKVVLPLLFFVYCAEMDVSKFRFPKPRSWVDFKAWFKALFLNE